MAAVRPTGPGSDDQDVGRWSFASPTPLSTTVGQQLVGINCRSHSGTMSTVVGLHLLACDDRQPRPSPSSSPRPVSDSPPTGTSGPPSGPSQADAAIDPSMVMRYYGNKERLFAAAAEFDLELPDLDSGAARRGRCRDGRALPRTLGAGRSAVDPAAGRRDQRGRRGTDADDLRRTTRAGHRRNHGATRPTPRHGPASWPRRCSAWRCAATCWNSRPWWSMARQRVVDWIGPTLQRYLVG